MEAGQKRSKNKREKCVERRQGLKVSERGGNRPACASQKEKDPEEVVRRERRADLPTQAEEAAISFNPSERAHGLPSGGVIGKKGEHLSRLEVMPTKTPSRLNSRNITDGQMWISEGGRRRRIKYQRIPPPPDGVFMILRRTMEEVTEVNRTEPNRRLQRARESKRGSLPPLGMTDRQTPAVDEGVEDEVTAEKRKKIKHIQRRSDAMQPAWRESGDSAAWTGSSHDPPGGGSCL